MSLACEECQRVTDDACGWIGKVVETEEFDLDLDPFVVFYCPTCAEREFDFVSLSPPGR